jgi:hypothetical protein
MLKSISVNVNTLLHHHQRKNMLETLILMLINFKHISNEMNSACSLFFLKYCSLDNKQKQWINWPSMTNKSSFQETDSFKSKSNGKKDCSMHCLSLRFLCWCRQLDFYVIDHSYKLFISLEICLKFINIKINVWRNFYLSCLVN